MVEWWLLQYCSCLAAYYLVLKVGVAKVTVVTGGAELVFLFPKL